MICGYCGQVSGEGAKFCRHCGAALVAQGAQAQAGTNGAPVQPTAQQTVQQPGSAQAPAQDAYYGQFFEQTAPQKKKKTWIPIVIVAAAAVVALFVILKLVRGGGGARPETTIANFEAAMNDLDIEKMVACIDPDSRESVQETLSSEMMGSMSELTSLFSDAFTFSMDVQDIDYTDNTHCVATVYATMEYSIFGYSDSESSTTKIPLVKEGNTWYIEGDALGDLF